jgi:iron-sulfur cluster assembly accessory protein
MSHWRESGSDLIVCVKGTSWFFEDETSDLDQTFTSHGIPIYVDMMSAQYVEGTEIDYVEGLQGAGFKFVNPQAKQTCGCGSSFST